MGLGLSLIRNNAEGATLAFTDVNLVQYLAFVPRRFLEEHVGEHSDTPEISAWFKENSVEVSRAVVACNVGADVDPPQYAFLAQGSFSQN